MNETTTENGSDKTRITAGSDNQHQQQEVGKVDRVRPQGEVYESQEVLEHQDVSENEPTETELVQDSKTEPEV